MMERISLSTRDSTAVGIVDMMRTANVVGGRGVDIVCCTRVDIKRAAWLRGVEIEE